MLNLKLIGLGVLFGLVAKLFNYVLDNSLKVYDVITKRKLTQGKSTLFRGIGTGKLEKNKG